LLHLWPIIVVQSQLKALAANPSRTPEQERFLHLLVNAQQQIHLQGRSQMQAALAANKVTASSAAPVVSLTTTPTKPTSSELLCFTVLVSDIPMWASGCKNIVVSFLGWVL